MGRMDGKVVLVTGGTRGIGRGFGSLTGLVNNAIAQEAISTGGDSHVDEISNEIWGDIIRVALWGTMWGCKYAIPHMLKAGRGSICNTIITGFILNGSKSMQLIVDTPELNQAFQRNIMVPRFGEPADIAGGATFLLSDEAKYVTGIEMPTDGGALCHQPVPQLDMVAMAKAKDS